MNKSTIRHRSKTRGLKLEKSHDRKGQSPGCGMYRLTVPSKNRVVFGGNRKAVRATLEECAGYIHPEALEDGELFDPKRHKKMIRLAIKRFGHPNKFSLRVNPSDLRRHG